MNMFRTAGIALTAGFLLYVAAMLIAPQLYNTKDISQRLAIIDKSLVRWNLSQFLFAIGPAVSAAGFLALAYSRRGGTKSVQLGLGALVFAAGAGIAVWLVYRQTLDPAAFWESPRTSELIGYGFLGLALLGLIVLGSALADSGLPGWLGYLMAGCGSLLLIITLATRASGGFFFSVLVYLITFISGIVIWRQ